MKRARVPIRAAPLRPSASPPTVADVADAAQPRASERGLWLYYAGFGLSRLATVAVLPIVSRVLGPVGFGFFEASFALMLASMIVADPGMGAAVVRFRGGSELPTDAVDREAAVVQVVASTLAFAVFAVPALLVAAPDAPVATTLTALLAFTVVEGLSVVGAGILRAANRYRLFAALSLLRVATAVTAGALGAAYGGPAAALYGVALSGLGFAVVGARPLVSAAAHTVRGVRRRLLRYGVPLIGTSVMTWALSLSDRVFLRAWGTAAELGLYSASYRVGGVIAMFVAGPLALAWIPVARRAAPGAERRAVTLEWALRLALVALGGGVALVAVSGRLVPAVFGDSFASDPVVVAAVCASGWLLGLYPLLATETLVAQSTLVLAGVALAVVAVNLIANAALIAAFGTHGAAAATLLSYAALCALAAGVQPHRPTWALSPRHTALAGVLLALLALATTRPLLAVTGMLAAGAALAARRAGRA